MCLYLSSLGCFLSVFPKFLSKVVSYELDHTGVWEIGCGSAPDGSIIPAFCVNVPKTLYYEVQVVLW